MTKVAFQMYSTIFVFSSTEMHGKERKSDGGLGEGGGVTLGDAGWGEGHQRTAAKLMPFFFLCTGSEKQSSG